MNRIIFSIIILSITFVFSKDIIAIIDLEHIDLSDKEAQILTQRLTTKLISIDKYEVVERNSMDKILSEQKFQHSGCTNSECAVEIGQLLNADFIIIGSVNKLGHTYAIDARLIDVALGKGIISAEYTMNGEIDKLLTEGIESIANQLCEISTSNTLSDNTSLKNQQTKYIWDFRSDKVREEENPNPIIKRDKLVNKNPIPRPDWSGRFWSVGAGFFTSKMVNVLYFSRDIKLSDKTALFGYIGFPVLYGVGVSWQHNYNDNGIFASISIGWDAPGGEYGNMSIAYQRRISKTKPYFFSIGVQHVGVEYEYQELQEMQIVGPLKTNLLIPVISFDYRF